MGIRTGLNSLRNFYSYLDYQWYPGRESIHLVLAPVPQVPDVEPVVGGENDDGVRGQAKGAAKREINRVALMIAQCGWQRGK